MIISACRCARCGRVQCFIYILGQNWPKTEFSITRLIATSARALEPLPLIDTVTVGGTELITRTLPKGFVLREDIGLITAAAVNGQVVHRTQTRVLETRATLTPKGDYLLMFPQGDHYAKSKGEKVNSMMSCRSSDHGKTWNKPVVAYDLPYGQHGFVPLIPRGTQRIYCFGTQPVLGNWTEAKNCPLIYRLTGPDGVTRLIVFAGRGPDKQMQQSVSMDNGKT